MEVLHPICRGIDVHKKSIVACLIMNGQKNLQTFGTMTEDLLAMLDWLLKSECHQVAMESTGSYWKPVYNILESADMKEILAAVAVAHALLVIIYHMLKDGTTYNDLGTNFFDQLNKQAVVKRTVKRLEALGYTVTVEPVVPAA